MPIAKSGFRPKISDTAMTNDRRHPPATPTENPYENHYHWCLLFLYLFLFTILDSQLGINLLNVNSQRDTAYHTCYTISVYTYTYLDIYIYLYICIYVCMYVCIWMRHETINSRALQILAMWATWFDCLPMKMIAGYKFRLLPPLVLPPPLSLPYKKNTSAISVFYIK